MHTKLKTQLGPTVAALLCALLLAGCGAAPAAQSTPQDANVRDDVIIAISSEPESGFDPTFGWGHGTTPLVQSTLVEYTQDMRIEGDLATDYAVGDDGLSWVFTLRQDAFFTDGAPVTAADVAFTFSTAKAGASSHDLTSMAACTASGTYEVTFTLTAPTSTFINTVASVGIVPQHAYGPDYADAPIGSGPWMLVQWDKGQQVILQANEDYYGTPPAINKATLVFMDEDAAFTAALAGQVDVALVSATQAGHDIEGMQLTAVSTQDNRGLTLPMAPAEGLLSAGGHPIGNNVTSQLAIRQALAYGIDREQLASDAAGGWATPAYSENDGMPWNNPEVAITTDAAYARQLLAEDGWADGDGDGIVEKDGLSAAFTCLYPSGDSLRQAVAMAAAEQALTLGIAITVEGTSWDDIARRMYSDAVLMGWGSSSPYTSYLLYHSSGALGDDYYNPEGFSSPVVDGYLDAALQAPTSEAAYEQWRLAQWNGSTGTSMRGECPWVWLVNVQHLYYVRTGLDIGTQQLHAHGASWTLLQNLREWHWA